MPLVLSPLPYGYAALEPAIDARTIELHHTKHHQSYIDGYNKAQGLLASAISEKNTPLIKHLHRELAFHGSGNILHDIYWNSMTPELDKRVLNHNSHLGQDIARSFASEGGVSSVDMLRQAFVSAGASVEGSGWVLLTRSPIGGLQVQIAERHQNMIIANSQVLLACDVWEHAYYLNYQNNRGAYLEAFWSIINWEWVSMQYAK
jgi:superoxide dismutase, Fe-Mn family